MNTLPLTALIFSLIAGNIDKGGATSDVKGEIIGRYKGLQVEETQEVEGSTCHEEPSTETNEELI